MKSGENSYYEAKDQGAVMAPPRITRPDLQEHFSKRRQTMLYWAAVFFIIALAAALLGFTTIAGAAYSVAKILFFVFLVLFVVALVMGLMTGRGPAPPA